MRCLNCSMVCLDTETRCAACGYELAEPEGWKPTTRLAKWGYGIPLLLASGFFLLGALALGFNAYEKERDGVRPFSTEELLSLQGPEDLDSPWVNYRFKRSLSTFIHRTKVRKGVTRITGYYLLVQVGDRWALTRVPNSFGGDRLVGEVQGFDGDFSHTMAQVAKRYPAQARRILPYVIDAEYPHASSTRWGYVAAGIMAILGLVFGSGAMRCLGTKFPSATVAAPAQGVQLRTAFRAR